MSHDGMCLEVRLEEMNIEKGYALGEHASYESSSEIEMQFSGKLLESLGARLLECGIDPRAVVGSEAHVTFEFASGPYRVLPVDRCVGWVEVYPSSFAGDGEAIFFNMHLSFGSSNFADIAAVSSLPLRIEPMFALDADLKLIPIKTGTCVQLNIRKVKISSVLEPS